MPAREFSLKRAPLRRDSFITHRAFCDALAQESARNPVSLGGIGSHLFSGSNMSLGLSQIGSQMSAGQDQNHPPTDILRLGSTRSGQFDNLIGQSMGSGFRPSHTMASSSFFLPESEQDYRQESNSPHELLSNKPLHGLMQLAGLHNNPSSSAGPGIFNLSFFPNSRNNGNNIDNDGGNTSNLLLPNPFNGTATGNGNDGPSLFSDNLVGEHLTSAIPSLYSTSLQNPNIAQHLSATALLQKAAQLGSTSSNTSASLLQTFGSSSSSNAKSEHSPHFAALFTHDHHNNNAGNNHSHHQNRSHIQDLVTSITGSLNTFAGPASQDNDYGYSGTKLNFGDQSSLKLHRNTSFSNNENAKLHRGGGRREGLTRDFLGILPAGELVRSMSGGRDLEGGFGEIRPLDSERKQSAAAAPKSPSFGGGGVNFQ